MSIKTVTRPNIRAFRAVRELTDMAVPKDSHFTMVPAAVFISSNIMGPMSASNVLAGTFVSVEKIHLTQFVADQFVNSARVINQGQDLVGWAANIAKGAGHFLPRVAQMTYQTVDGVFEGINVFDVRLSQDERSKGGRSKEPRSLQVDEAGHEEEFNLNYRQWEGVQPLMETLYYKWKKTLKRVSLDSDEGKVARSQLERDILETLKKFLKFTSAKGMAPKRALTIFRGDVEWYMDDIKRFAHPFRVADKMVEMARQKQDNWTYKSRDFNLFRAIVPCAPETFLNEFVLGMEVVEKWKELNPPDSLDVEKEVDDALNSLFSQAQDAGLSISEAVERIEGFYTTGDFHETRRDIEEEVEFVVNFAGPTFFRIIDDMISRIDEASTESDEST